MPHLVANLPGGGQSQPVRALSEETVVSVLSTLHEVAGLQPGGRQDPEGLAGHREAGPYQQGWGTFIGIFDSFIQPLLNQEVP